jgi:CheY-like chemotaxis protein
LTRAANTVTEALTGIQVLIVDDDDDSLTLMQTALEYAGALVVTALTARTALEALGRIIPDVILSDLKMPHEDGLAFVRQLRGLPSLRGVPVLAVTGYHDFYDRQELFAAGFLGIIRKPITFPNLIQTVASIAEERKTGR